MTNRAGIIGLGLVALACRMDNPAFDPWGETSVADESGEGDGDGDPSESSESLGEGESEGDGDGDGDGEPSDDCNNLAASCGLCEVCDQMTGECVVDVGGPCQGPSLNCSEFLFGASEGVCYALKEVTLAGRCGEQGTCEQPPPSECPLEKGGIHFACEQSCVSNPQGCPQLAKAAEVEISAMCLVDGESTPECTTLCANGVESFMEYFGCIDGGCESLGVAAYCEGYLCNEQGTSCLESCQTEAQCSAQFTCAESECVPG